MSQTWLRKVSDLQVLPTDTGANALFRCGLSLQDLRTKVSRWKGANAVERAQVQALAEDEWLARRSAPVPDPTPQSVARRSPIHAVMELLPSLTPGERHCVLFRLATMDRPAVECRETALLDAKRRMQEIIRERPLAAWGEGLAPFVHAALQDAGDRPVEFKSPDACRSGLALLYVHPPRDWGYKRTRLPALDPPVRVVDIRKESFHSLRVDEPLSFPAKPPPDAGRAFTVWVQLQDVNGEWSAALAVPWCHFCENPSWKASVDLDFSLWASTRERWCYTATPRSIYSFAEWQRQLASPAPCRSMSPVLERYYASPDYDRDIEIQRASEERARGSYKFSIDDVDPEVWQMLEDRRKRRRLAE